MNDFIKFKNRIYSFQQDSLPNDGRELEVNLKIKDKVDKNGELKQFYGDTVVFELDENEKSKLLNLQDILYNKCKEYFAVRLPKSTFHMTLHDFNSSVNCIDLSSKMKETEVSISKIFKDLSELQENTMIKMKSTYAFNMVNTSIVLGLEPVNEYEYDKLMFLYNRFEQVKKLDYPLTPHITLAYYKDKNVNLENIEKLKEAIKEINSIETCLNLSLENLCYEHFVSMSNYQTIFYVSGPQNNAS
ncbi:MAG: ligT like phosphoesterase [Bacillota bacterium]|nr:ligT like phosphoesterase [Bacillota bacterium]